MADTTFTYGAGNPTAPTGSVSNTSGFSTWQRYAGISDQAPSTTGGTTTRTYTTTNVPNDLALKQKINAVFQKYYGRDANQSELNIYLPQIKNLYTTPAGKTKTVVSEVRDSNGNLISTSYKTADNLDPSVWLEDKLKSQVATGVTPLNKLNIPEGPAGKNFINFKNFAAKNGILLSDEAANDYASKVQAGILDDNTIYNTIRESAASAFPSLGEKIKSGIDLKTLADPYIQSMSNILELPYSSVDLFDPKIRSALSFTLPDGSLGTKSIYDFEKELRQDPRWQYTSNAKQAASNAAVKVLKDFGFMG